MVIPGVTVAFYVKGIFESCGGMYRRYSHQYNISRPRTQVHSSCRPETKVLVMQGLWLSEALPSTLPKISDIQQCYAKSGRITYKFIFSEKCSCTKRTKYISVSLTKKITEGLSPAADMWAKATEMLSKIASGHTMGFYVAILICQVSSGF